MKIGEILVSKGYVTQQQVDGVLAVKGEDAQIGQTLIQWGLLTEQQLMEALEIQTPPPPPPPVQPQQPPVYQQPPVGGSPDLTMDKVQTSKFKIDLKTLIWLGSLLVTIITGYFTFQAQLDSKFDALEDTDDSVMVELDKRLTTMETSVDKRLTELENKFTPIGDGVYSVDPSGTWPPSRGEFKMKDELSRNKIQVLEKTIEDLKQEIKTLEKKVFNLNGNH